MLKSNLVLCLKQMSSQSRDRAGVPDQGPDHTTSRGRQVATVHRGAAVSWCDTPAERGRGHTVLPSVCGTILSPTACLGVPHLPGAVTGPAMWHLHWAPAGRGNDRLHLQAGGESPPYFWYCGQLVCVETFMYTLHYLTFQVSYFVMFVLQNHFTRQPHVVRMVLSSLTSLAQQSGVTADEVQATILPLLKGVPLLIDCFLRVLPSAKPPESWVSLTTSLQPP